MIRILHIVSTISQSSGVMNFIMNYYRKIDNKKIIFDFMYFKDIDNNFKNEIEKYGGQVYKIGTPRISLSFFKQMKTFFKDNADKYIAIHCHPIFSFIIFSKIARKYGIENIIQHSHTIKFSNKKISAIRNKFIMLFSNSQITHYVACSIEASKVFKRKELEKKGCLILNNGIDVTRYIFNEKNRKKIRNEFNISNQTKIIGHIGRFSSEKNHDILLEIFHKYNLRVKDSKLMFVGDGPLENEIRKKISKLNLNDKVIFCGVRNDIPVLLSAMDYFILPSDFEGFGIVALEAQANGLITVCSTGVPDCAIITKDTFKFNIYDEKEIKSIIDLLLKYSDYERKDNSIDISKAGYNIEYEVKKLEKFYLSLASKKEEK